MRHVVDYIKEHRSIFFIVLAGFLFHMLIIFPSGSKYCYEEICGLFFWGAHAHDAVWHLAVVAKSFSAFPFIVPTYSGELLSGYNYLLDLILFLLSKTGIPPLISYFKILPIVWFITFTFFAITVGRRIKDSPLFIGILLFLLYFGGGFSYFLTLYHNKTIWGSATYLAMQAGLTLINVQFALSLVLLLIALTIIFNNKHSTRDIFVLGLLIFFGLGLKFYGGVVISFCIMLYCFELLMRHKDVSQFFKNGLILSLFFFLAVVAFYNPFHSLKTGSVLSFVPFAIVHPIIEEPTLAYMPGLANMRYILLEGGLGPRLLMIELLTLFLFLFLNLGSRCIVFFFFAKDLLAKKLTRLHIYIFLAMMFSTFLAVFFVQKGQWWNTIQFFYYSIFFGSILTAEYIYRLLRSHHTIGIFLGSVLLLLTLPNSIDLIREFSTFPPPSYLSKYELDALKFLKSQPDGVVHASLSLEKPPRLITKPLSMYSDNPYVAAFSGKQVYFSDATQMELLGIDYKKRLNDIVYGVCDIKKDITYYYRLKRLEDAFYKNCYDATSFKQIYNNEEVMIYSLH